MADWWEAAPLVAPAPGGGSRAVTVGTKRPEKPDNPPSGYRWSNGPDSDLIPIKGGPADKDASGTGGADAKAAETKAAFLTGNLMVATDTLSRALKRDPAAAKPTWGQWAASLGGVTAAGAANSPERRQVEAAQRGILEAALTLGTGAAYNKEQLEGYREQYFPTVTDDEATIAEKGRMLRGLLVNARVAAGSAAPKIDEAMATLGLEGDPLKVSEGLTNNGRITEDEAKAQMQERIRRGDRPSDIVAWLTSVGRPPTDEDIKAIAGAAGDPRTKVIDRPLDGGGLQDILNLGLPDNLQPPEWVGDLGDSTRNVVAGMVQGAATLPDMIAKQAGREMGAIASGLGFEEAGKRLSNPLQISDLVERRSPTQAGALGTANRIGGQILGGVLGVPARATTAIVEGIAGKAPVPVTRGALGGPTGQEALDRVALKEAGERQGVDLLPADVGGETVKALTSGATQAPLSRGSVVKTARKSMEQLGDAAGRAATSEGRVIPADEAGEAVRKGGVEYIRQITDRASRWYDKANEWAGNIKIMPPNAVAVLEREIATKKEAGPIAAEMVGELEKVLATLNQAGGITVTGMREARKLLGAMARGEKLRGTDAQRIFGEVLEAARGDMAAALTADGKGRAANMFAKADRLWAERIETVDKVLEPIIGAAKSGEDILKAVESMAGGRGGGVRRLQRVMATLPKDEKADAVATVIDRMGKARASAQDDTGSLFSAETFLTNWNNMSGKGKAALFGSGELRQNLDDIAKIAFAKRQTNQLASKSNTPIGVATNLGVIGGVAIAHPILAFAGAATQYGGGKLLASRHFTRWLARTPSGLQAALRHITSLDKVARADPVIANDVMALKEYLVQPVTPRLAAAPASETEHGGGDDGAR